MGQALISSVLKTAADKDRIFTRLLGEAMTPAQVQRLVSV